MIRATMHWLKVGDEKIEKNWVKSTGFVQWENVGNWNTFHFNHRKKIRLCCAYLHWNAFGRQMRSDSELQTRVVPGGGLRVQVDKVASKLEKICYATPTWRRQ